MSLRDSIKDLRNVAKTLNRTNFNFEMNALEKFLDGIKVDKPLKPPEDILKPLLEKFLRGERNFSSRELRNLPFIIYEPSITSHDTIKILRELDFSKTSHLRGVLSVYLLNYDGSDKTEILRRTLNGVSNVDLASLKKIFSARDKFFSENRMINMRRLFTEKLSIESSLEIIGLSNFYKASNFIQSALITFFRLKAESPENHFKILNELDAGFDTYKNIFPYIADALIQAVAFTGYGKKECMEIFYRRLGDPRFGDGRFNWKDVSQKSRNIFCHWLSEEDLEIFFELIRQTAVNRMWRYREKFWRTYLPYIIKTKIFLGSNAKSLAAQLQNKIKLNHGTLNNASDEQSVFVFQMGRYIFSEWSHDGKLRVHAIDSTINLFDTTEDFFEKNSINRDVLVKNFIADWIHHSPKTYSWQRKVSEWLRKNCKIDKTQSDWGL